MWLERKYNTWYGRNDKKRAVLAVQGIRSVPYNHGGSIVRSIQNKYIKNTDQCNFDVVHFVGMDIETTDLLFGYVWLGKTLGIMAKVTWMGHLVEN